MIIKTFINGRKKNIEDLKPAVQISTSQKSSNRTTLKSVKKNETVRKNTSSSAPKPNTMTYMQKKPCVTVSQTKTQQKSSAVDISQQKIKKANSQGTKQPAAKQPVKPTTKPSVPKQATTKTQKVTEKTKTLTRKSRKNV